MSIFTKKYAFAALFAALFTILLFNCDPDSTTTAGITEKTGASSEFVTFSVSGFTPNGVVSPDGEYSLITDLTYLGFSSEYAEGGAVEIDLTKPVYKGDITYSDNTTETWYLWASVAPSRYILSRPDINGLWYFEDAPAAGASRATSPKDVAAWKKSSETATVIAADITNTKASAEPATARVSVIPVGVIAIDGNATRSVEVGRTIDLDVTFSTPDKPSNQSVTWASGNASVATVDENGLVSGVSQGTATITVTSKSDNSKTASVTVTVTAASGGGSTAPKPVTGIVISVKAGSSDSIAVGNSTELEAAITPADADNPAVDWQSDNTAVATVDANGVVNGVAAGTAKITATSKDGSNKTSNEQTITVVASAKPVTGITIALKSGSNASIVAGTTTELEATVAPTDATDQSVEWRSSNTSIATVDINTGVVTGLVQGTTDITAVSKDGSSVTSNTVTITVTPKLVSGISIALKSGNSSSIFTGDTTELEATVSPSDAADTSVNWRSSDASVATVNASGVVTALAVGSTNITAVANDGSNVTSSAVTITVTPKPVSSINIALKSGSSNSIAVGSTTELEETVSPSDAADKSVDWRSSDTTVATVNASGVVTALAVGNTDITAVSKDGSNVTSNTVPITVTPKLVSGISIALKSGSSDSIVVGSNTEFTATVTPSDAADTSVDWQSSDTAVATVSPAGVVTGVDKGTADITAVSKDGSNKTSNAITVTVTKLVSGISIALKSGSSDSIFAGDTTEFEATVTPSDANDTSIEWKSDDTTVATVDPSTGVVSGVKAGTADITAVSKDGSSVTSNAVTVTITTPVTVSGQPTVAYNATTKKLSFSVKFSEAVTVDTSGGTPNYKFAVTKSSGATAVNKTAAYANGSGTDTLVFEYTKESGVYGTASTAANPIDLNGGTLTGTSVTRVSLSGITANANAATIAADVAAVGIASAATIPDTSLSALTFYDANTAPAKGRLNGPTGVVWAPRTAAVGQWWQVDMGSARDVVRVAIQGRAGQYTMTYKLQYSLDGTTWTDYNSGQVLTGNTDPTGTATANLTVFSARYVRFYPQTWQGYPSSRFEVYENK